MHASLIEYDRRFFWAFTSILLSVFMGARSLGGPPPPFITNQPMSQTVIAGSNVTFRVGASSSTPMSFQWRFNGMDIPGANEATLPINNAQPSDMGTYRVRVSNSTGFTDSSNATLTVIVPARITQPPQNREVALCSTVSFNVGAAGTFPLRYQWYFNSNAIPNATNSTLILSNVYWSHGGSYYVVVTNAGGTATSSNVVLAVYSSGGPIGPSAWRVPLGAMDSQLPNTPLGTPPPVTGSKCGPLTENARWIQLLPEDDGMFAIDTVGSNFDTIMAVYQGDSFSDLIYVGCDNNGAPDGVRSEMRFPVRHCESYFVAVDGMKAKQGTVQLNWKLGRPPVITRQPQSQMVARGSNVSFHVEAASVPAPHFQWRFNGADMADATNATWTLNNVQPTNAGSYSVVVQNFFGVTNSQEAILVVQSPAARLTALGVAPDGFHFRLDGPSGPYAIEASADLASWSFMTTANATNGTVEVVDPEAALHQQRFYRAKSP